MSVESSPFSSIQVGGVGYYGNNCLLYADVNLNKEQVKDHPITTSGNFFITLPPGLTSAEFKASGIVTAATIAARNAKSKNYLRWENPNCVLVKNSSDIPNAKVITVSSNMEDLNTEDGHKTQKIVANFNHSKDLLDENFSILCTARSPSFPLLGDPSKSNLEMKVEMEGVLSQVQILEGKEKTKFSIASSDSASNRLELRQTEPIANDVILYATGEFEDKGFGLKITLIGIKTALSSIRLKAQSLIEFGPPTHTRNTSGQVLSGKPASCSVVVNGETRSATALVWANSLSEVQIAMSQDQVLPVNSNAVIKCPSLSARKPIRGVPAMVRVINEEGSHENGVFMLLENGVSLTSMFFVLSAVLVTVVTLII